MRVGCVPSISSILSFVSWRFPKYWNEGQWLLLTPTPTVGLVSCYLRAKSMICTGFAGARIGPRN